MKKIQLLTILFALSVCLSCEKEKSKETSYRITEYTEFTDNLPFNKVNYVYDKSDKINEIQIFSGSENSGNQLDLHSVEKYDYNNNEIGRTKVSYLDGVVFDSVTIIIEIGDGVMTRYGDEYFIYDNGLLKERTDTINHIKWVYIYDGSQPITISQYTMNGLNKYEVSQKFEIQYFDDKQVIRKWKKNAETEWVVEARIDKYFMDGLCVRYDKYIIEGETETLYRSEKYTYNSLNDIEKVDIERYDSGNSYSLGSNIIKYDEFGNRVLFAQREYKIETEFEIGETNITLLTPPPLPQMLLLGAN